MACRGGRSAKGEATKLALRHLFGLLSRSAVLSALCACYIRVQGSTLLRDSVETLWSACLRPASRVWSLEPSRLLASTTPPVAPPTSTPAAYSGSGRCRKAPIRVRPASEAPARTAGAQPPALAPLRHPSFGAHPTTNLSRPNWSATTRTPSKPCSSLSRAAVRGGARPVSGPAAQGRDGWIERACTLRRSVGVGWRGNSGSPRLARLVPGPRRSSRAR